MRKQNCPPIAGRLVVDTGIHHQRWSREQAVAVLHETDGDPVVLCGQEIERYACSPGQACGYMVGKVAILRLRDKARRALGPRFDIRQFHDAVLLRVDAAGGVGDQGRRVHRRRERRLTRMGREWTQGVAARATTC